MKKMNIHTIFESMIPIIVALIVGYIIILLSGFNPNEAYISLLQGSFGSTTQILNTLFAATPLIFTGLATAISFKAGLYNMGAEGQFYIGAFFATYVGITFTNLPPLLHVSAALGAGMLGGVLFALVPAVIRAYFNVDEMVTTLMLNYVAILFTTYLASYPFRAPGSSNPETIAIESSATIGRMASTSQLHYGFLIAAFVFVIVYVLLNRTVFGYEIESIGKNRSFSASMGMNVPLKIVFIILTSGVISGLAGAVEVLGTHRKFFSGMGADYGWTGLTIALIGKYNPIGVFFGAILFGALKTGGSTMEIMTGVPRSLISIVEGLIVLFMTIDMLNKRFEFFRHFNEFRAKRITKKLLNADIEKGN